MAFTAAPTTSQAWAGHGMRALRNPTPCAPRAPPARLASLPAIPSALRSTGRGRIHAAVRVVAAAAPQAGTVRIIIQGRNTSVTPAIREYVETKVSNAVAPFEGAIREIDVKLAVHGGDRGPGPREQRTEITAYTLKNGVVRVEDSEDNLYSSIDLVTDKLSRKLRKIKERALVKGRWPGHRGGHRGDTVINEVLDDTEVVDKLPLDKDPQLPEEVVRTKFFHLEPMDLEDAVDALQSVGHDFYVYMDKDSKQVQVLYKRRSHGYGVIVPKLRE